MTGLVTARAEQQADASALVGAVVRRARVVDSAAAAILALVLGAVGLAVFLPALALILACRAMPATIHLGSRIAISIVMALAWLPLATAGLQVLGLGFQPIATWILPIAAAAAIGGARGAKRERHRQVPAGWLVALACLGFLMSAGLVAVGGEGRGVDQRLGLASAGEDGASHYAIFDTMLRVGGLAYGREAREITAQWPYPPGYHVMAASLASALDHTIGTSPIRGGRTDAFWLSGLLVFSFLVGMTATLAERLASRWGASARGRWTAATLAGVAVLGWYPFGLFQTAFYPQIMALAVLVGMLLVAIERPSMPHRLVALAFGAALLTIAWSWFFLLPIAGLVTLGWLVAARREVRSHLAWDVTVALVAILGSVAPIWINLGTGSLNAITAPGGVTNIPGAAVVALVLMATAATLHSTTAARWHVLFALVVTGAFSIAIREYQLAVAGETAYFYFKSLFTPFLLAVAVLCAFAGARLSGPRSVATIALVIAAVVATFQVPLLQPEKLDPVRYRSGQNAGPLRGIFLTYFGHQREMDRRFVVVWNVSGSDLNDYIGSRWMSALAGATNEEFFTFMRLVYNNQDPEVLADFVDDHASSIAVVTSDRSFERSLRQAGASDESIARLVVVRAGEPQDSMPPMRRMARAAALATA